MDGHAPANPLRRSLPGADRVKPERNLGAAKPPSAKGGIEPPALRGLSHGTAGCGPACPVVWEGRGREASPYPDCKAKPRGRGERTAGSRSFAPFRGFPRGSAYPGLAPWAKILRSYGALPGPESVGFATVPRLTPRVRTCLIPSGYKHKSWTWEAPSTAVFRLIGPSSGDRL